MRGRPPKNWLATCLILLTACAGECPDEPGGGGGDGAAVEAAFAPLAPLAPGLTNGAGRVIVAALGGPADGVTITETGNILSAALGGSAGGLANTRTGNVLDVVCSIDTDGDGTRDADVVAQAVFPLGTVNFEEGAHVTLSLTTGAGDFVSAEFDLMTFQGVSAHASTITGTVDLVSSEDIDRVDILEGNINVDLSTGIFDGFLDFNAFPVGEGEAIGGTIHFEPDEDGNIRIRVTGRNDSFEFFIP